MPKKELRKMVNRQHRVKQSHIDDMLFNNKKFYSESHSYTTSSDDELIIKYVLNTLNNVCFRDHIVNGKPCLPTDAYLELIYVACQSYLKFNFIAMDRVVMSNPIIANGNDDITVRLHLVRNDESYSFKLVSDDPVTQKEIIHIRGVVSNHVVNNLENKVLSLNDEDIIERFDVEHFYRKESSIYLGDFYRTLHSLNFYQQYAIGEILAPDSDNVFSMNPSIISAGLGSAITFSSHCIGESFCDGLHYFLPYRIDGLKLYGSLSEKNYRCIIKLIQHTKNSVECCLQIISEKGKLLFEIANFRLQRISVKQIVDDKDKVLPYEASTNEDVAIVGIAGRFPKSNGISEFWKMLKNAQDCIEEVAKDRWLEFADWYHASPENEGTACSKYGGFLESIDCFDPLFFNISPAEAELMDPQQRIFLEEAWSAIENAGYAPSSLSNIKCGVYIGCAEGDYSHVLAKTNKSWEAQSFPGTSSAVLAARISYLLNLKGPSMAIDTSCSSSLTAIHLAAESIRRGENELAIAGGINIFSSPLKQVLTSQIGMQSTDGRCHTFDQAANGTVFSEGCGVILLKSLSQAIEEGDNIWGVIKGSGINQDGKTNGITAPSALSQENLLSDIYHKFNIKPENISYVEAHGTGTVLGDPIEVQGLKGAFKKFTDRKNFCAIGSLKSNMGHAVYAAGVAGLIKLLLCLRYKKLVPSINYNNTNKHIDFDDSPFFVNKENRYWETSKNVKRMASVSSFGFSGSNAHIVLEEHIAHSQNTSLVNKMFIIPISAKSSAALNRNISNLYNFLSDKENLSEKINIANIAYTLQAGRDSMNYRAVFIVENISELVEKLALFLNDSQFSLGNGILVSDLDSNKHRPQTEIVQQDILEDWFAQENWEKLAEYWVSGNKVSWDVFYKDLIVNRVALPSYSFEKEQYWPKLKNLSAVKNEESIGVEKILPVRRINDEIDFLEKIEHDLTKFVHLLLRIPLDRLDANVNLTEFGFDSVNLVKYARTISDHFNVIITPAKLFSNLTISSIAHYLQKEHRGEINKLYSENVFSINKGNDDSQGETINSDHSQLDEIKLDNNERGVFEPIAIIGISGKFPKSNSLDQYWENLLAGKDCISEIPAERWNWKDYYSESPEDSNKTDIIWGGFLDDIQKFDPKFFGLSDEEAEVLDPQQRLLLKYAYKAIEDAGYNPKTLSNSSTGVFMGIGNNGYDRIVENSGRLLDGNFLTGALPSVGPNRISYCFDFHGPSEPIETACASSLVAINKAISEINNGVCDIAIVGAVNVIVTPSGHIAFNKAGLLSKEGRCKPFSSNADGFVRAEGVGVLVLKRLSSAKKDNDQIYAVIRGSGVNHNGKANFLTAPNPRAQSDLLESVYRKAGVDINTVTYIETHGTGTELGDAIEIEGLKSAFKNLNHQQSLRKVESSCAIGSVKSNIGHTELASGMASIIKVLYQMKTKTLAKTIHCDSINPYLQLEDSPFYIVRENQKWDTVNDEVGIPLPRRAGISAFGLSGVNAHVILEEYIDKQAEEKERETEQLIVLSARNKTQLNVMTQKLYEFLIENKEVALSDIAYTLQQGRESMQTRLAIVARNIEDLSHAFKNYFRPEQDASYAMTYFGDVNEKNTETKFLFQGMAGEQFFQELIKTNDLKRIALYWINGGKIDWDLLQKNKFSKRISLPGYPFCENNYWATKKIIQSETRNETNVFKKNISNLNSNKLFLRWYEDA